VSQGGAILRRHGGWKNSAWQRSNARFVDRFRKQIVATALIFGDRIAAATAAWVGGALTKISGLDPAHTKHLPLALLVAAFFCLRLYTGCGPSPYEGFRLRTIGIAGFIAVDLLIGDPVGEPGSLLVAALTALHLLILGHYIGAIVRTQLIHLDLWGASTALSAVATKAES